MARTARRKPVTVEEIETWLDFLAGLMERTTRRQAELYLPIWRALERELAARREADAIFDAVRKRHQRSVSTSNINRQAG
jgi:hypothetical protein